nr:ATPase subunit 6 [Ischnobaenella hainana]
MMTNLFSTFDPSTSMNTSLNWVSTIVFIMIMPMSFWLTLNRNNYMITILKNMLLQETKMLLNNTSLLSILFVSMFMFILFNNILGLLPYMFTSSSHLMFTMSIALPLWLSLMLFGWTKKTQMMFAHLIPEGSPPSLMPFMVCIETISNIIRPGSLAVRLTANMIAGHLLMSLLGNSMMNMSSLTIMIIIIIQITLLMFEMAVAIIQAYVISILSTLYTKEVI